MANGFAVGGGVSKFSAIKTLGVFQNIAIFHGMSIATRHITKAVCTKGALFGSLLGCLRGVGDILKFPSRGNIWRGAGVKLLEDGRLNACAGKHHVSRVVVRNTGYRIDPFRIPAIIHVLSKLLDVGEILRTRFNLIDCLNVKLFHFFVVFAESNFMKEDFVIVTVNEIHSCQ